MKLGFNGTHTAEAATAIMAAAASGPFGQHDCYPIAAAYAAPSQFANRIVRLRPERGIGQRRPAGRQDGIVAGHHLREVGNKFFEVRKDPAAAEGICGAVPGWL